MLVTSKHHKWKNISTCLSPNVYSLVKLIHTVNDEVNEDLVFTNSINWVKLDETIDPMVNCKENNEDYALCIEKLSTYMHRSLINYSLLNANDLIILQKQIAWTGCERKLISCYKLLRENSHSCSAVLATLLLISYLERILGNLYLLKGKSVPFLIRDLLKSNELTDVIGFIPVLVLRILMGSPKSLNIRNILWHGFVSPQEIDNRIGFFLIALLASMADKFSNLIIPRRILVDFDENCFQNSFSSLIINPELLKNIFSQSNIVLKPMLPFWEYSLELYSQKRYWECVVLILPQLENCLRCLFVSVNDCPEMLLTAEITTFYLTFDEMLSEFYENTKENKLLAFMGCNIMEIFLDMFMYNQGPRLRDRISHGEANPATVGPTMASHLLFTSAALTAKFSSEKNSLYAQMIVKEAESYVSKFHPCALAMQEVQMFVSNLCYFNANDLKIFQEENKISLELDKLLMGITLNDAEVNDYFEKIKVLATGLKVATTFRTKIEIEKATLVRKATENATDTFNFLKAICIERKELLEQHQLRSRQRENYKTLLKSISLLCQGLALIAVILCHNINTLNEPSGSEKHLKSLKNLVQIAEKLKTETKRHRWKECLVLIDQLNIRNFCDQ